jgi:hypothetical protein
LEEIVQTNREMAKLVELRAKTDRELTVLVSRRLDSGIAAAANRQRAEAEQARAEVRRLLAVIDLLAAPNLAPVDAKLSDLEAWLQATREHGAVFQVAGHSCLGRAPATSF